ncbi:TIGR03943 family putative permease subunit [Prosthecobacter sp.]
MKAQRLLIHLLSVLLLILWGGVMIYFHVSGRVINYLPSDGLFRPLMLIGGIGMVVLALFNLLTYSQDEGACCSHDHDHAHDGSCGHDHGHSHKDGGCGHDHSHDHAHEHQHEHKDGGCGHGHDHGHAHTHEHSHDNAQHDHAHGILEEGSWISRLTAVAILAVPLTLAAVRSPDQFSANAILNKNFYTPNYGTGARAEQFSLANKMEAAKATAPKTTALKADAGTATKASKADNAPPPGVNAATAAMADGTKKVNEKDLPKPAQESKSYGTFTLEDLKAQVPQSKDGNFILEVPELYYTGGDVEVQKVLTGQMVETIAQVLPEKVNNAEGHRLRIFRMLVQCCAADARPYSVPVDFGKKAPDFKEMTWIKVVGKMGYKKEGDQTVPIIEATKVEETTAPDNAMIY